MCKNKVLALQLVPYLCVFYCDVVELGSYGKLKYYDTMTEEGKNDFRIVCIGFFFFSFMVSGACPFFFSSSFPLCMTSVTLCDLLFFPHFCLVFAIVFIWDWRRAIPWVIMLFHSETPNHLNCVTHSEKWCQQRKHKHTPTGSALFPTRAHNTTQKHTQSTLFF